ncbi:MAG TPA: histidine phosphatase family protein [Ktedonobacteraceae bacterium]
MPGKQSDSQAKEDVEINIQNVMFIRHGESEAHIGKAATHIEEVGLTEAGKRKADEIADMFLSIPDLIISSPYLRAWETAYPTIQHFSSVTHVTWPEVREFTYLGSLRGQCLTKQERSGKVDEFWKRCDPEHRDVDGESFSQFVGRARKTLAQLREMNGFIVIFTHEQFIRVVQCLLLEWTEEDMEMKPEHMKQFRKMLLDYPLPYGYVDDASWQQHLYQPEFVLSQAPLPVR